MFPQTVRQRDYIFRCLEACGVRSIDVKEKYIKPTRVFEPEDGVGIYRKRRR